MSEEPISISEELVDFVEAGTSKLIGTTCPERRPEAVRAVGAAVARDRTRMTVYVPAATGARTRANIERGSLVAATFARVSDLRTIQMKGPCVAIHTLDAGDRPLLERQLAAFTEALYSIGMSRSAVGRIAVWPAFGIELEIRALFQQTPGPSAGERLVLPVR